MKNSRVWILLVLILAAALRFYNLSGYLQFLGDQGRDALVVEGMIVYHKWTLLGPSASVGGFFTGPIYYYFMLPFLWVSRLDPIGPAYMNAIIGVLSIWLIYFFGKEFFNKRVGLIAAFLATISPQMVNISRFSWNPNPVPFFTILTVLSLYLARIKDKKIFTFFAGIGFGILFQLHYMNVAFGAVLGLTMLVIFPPRQWLWQFLLAALGFLIGNSLFLLFEIRHNFPNLRSVWEFVTRRGQTVSPRTFNIFWLEWDILRRLFEMLLNVRDTIWQGIIVWVSLLGLASWLKTASKKDNFKIKATIILVWLFLGAFGIGLYRGDLHDHYFGYMYPLPFFLLAVVGDRLSRKILTVPIFVAFIGILVYFMISGLYFWQPPNNQLLQTQKIDQTVLDYAGGQPYNLGLISSFNTDQAYRYYLEIWHKNPVTIEPPQTDPTRQTVTSQLIVICEDKKCEPLGNPLWQIAGFGQAQIVDEKTGPAGIKIFKLIHYK